MAVRPATPLRAAALDAARERRRTLTAPEASAVVAALAANAAWVDSVAGLGGLVVESADNLDPDGELVARLLRIFQELQLEPEGDA